MAKTSPVVDDVSLPMYLPYGDSLRIWATLAVVALHASAVRVVHIPQVSSLSWWTAHMIDSLCRWAVPVFIMLSGGLMLDVNRRETLVQFYGKRFTRVVIPLIFWSSFYFYWTASHQGEPVDWDVIKSSLWQGLPQYHLYFLFIIIGLYAVTPLLKLFTRHAPPVAQWLVTLAVLGLTVTGILVEHIQMTALTRFIPYLSYFFLGYLLRSIRVLPKDLCWLVLAFAVVSGVIIVKTYQLVLLYGHNDYRAFAFYDHFNVCVIVQSFTIFLASQVLFGSVEHGSLSKWIKLLAPNTFGIYLIHFAFLDLMRNYTAVLSDHLAAVALTIDVVAAFALSALVTLVLLRVPYMRAVVGGG